MRKTSGHNVPLQAVRNADSRTDSPACVHTRGAKKSPCLEVIKFTEWLYQTGTVIAKL
jgi:hypothetical protein